MEIYQKAFDIIERYFGTEEEDKDVRTIVFYREAQKSIIFSTFKVVPIATENQFAFGPGGDSQQPQQGFNF